MKTIHLVCLLTALLVLATEARAQTTAFTYQGRLTENGVPANGSNDFTFTLYDAASGGATVGTSNVVGDLAVANGLFTATLNFINFAAVPFDGNDRWLQIAVRPGASTGAYTNLLPRQLITSTPYAIRALSAGSAGSAVTASSVAAGAVTSSGLAAGAVGSNQLAAGAVTTGALADGAVTAPKMATVSNWFAVTIANPTPVTDDFFGYSVAAVGSDRVLIGAYQDDTGAGNAGAAYLFNANGTLLTTFTNPFPAAFDFFGYSVAALGSDRVLIGAYQGDVGAADAGAAYLFNANGALLTNFFNHPPVLNEKFGWAVAALGSDRVLIGAYGNDTGATDAGAAYLFNTNGGPLTTFTNPTPAASDFFGISVAAVGSDRVLVGASGDNTGASDAGAAYLFSTNGTLLTTITNPTPAANDFFGWSVAAVGSGRVLIGSYNDSSGGVNAGAAYLFSTNGTLLTTFTNPTPVAGDHFGISVAALGSDRVLIGARLDDTGASDSGAAYLFSTNGTLLNTFTNPTPAASDLFGHTVAGLGNDRVLIGAHQDDTGAANAGVAYLFSAESFTPGLVAEAVRAGAVTTTSLADGAVTAAKIGGVLQAGQIPNLDASKIAGGTLADARLSTNVALRNGGNAFTGNQTIAGSVGIGTTTPAHKLTVRTPTTDYGFEHTDGDVRLSTFLGGSAGGGWLGTISNHKLSFFVNDGSASMTVDTTGNVGIGTISPATKLDVNGIVTATSFSGQPGVMLMLGTTDTNALEFKVNNRRALRLEPTAFTDTVNVIGGSARNSVGAGKVGATIGGGGAGDYFGSHYTNRVEADFGTVSGGIQNTIQTNAGAATIGGGFSNTIGNDVGFSTIAGGYQNTIQTNAPDSGFPRRKTIAATIGGGSDNTILPNAPYATIPGGRGNSAAEYAFAAGRRAKANNIGAFVWADSTDDDFAATADNQFLIRATGGVAIGTNDPAGAALRVAGTIKADALLGMGTTLTLGTTDDQALEFKVHGIRALRLEPTAERTFPTFPYTSSGIVNVVGGSPGNSVGANLLGATIAGGGAIDYTGRAPLFLIPLTNKVTGDFGTVGGGGDNTSGYFATVGGGAGNTSSGVQATVGGGAGNTSSGQNATVPGGYLNSATGEGSLAAGCHAKANHTGAFVWADSTGNELSSTAANSVTMRASGGYRLFSDGSSPPASGVSLGAGQSSWSSISDRNVKKDFAPVDQRTILEKLAALSITQWHYKWESADVTPHIGPMAQDFKAAFYPGTDDKTITTQEADGVALAAIQGLNQKLEAEVKSKDLRIAELERRLSAIETLLRK